MDILKTRQYYEELTEEDLCNCAYCRNYQKEIKNAYPLLTEHLFDMGVDITKLYESFPIEPEEDGTILYADAQYLVMGNKDNFRETEVEGVHISLADSYPYSDIAEEHFIIEISPIRLPWTIKDENG